MVRKTASTLSVFILIGLLVVLIPNIIAQWSNITSSISGLASGNLPVSSKETGSFLPALWIAFLYFLFQLASVSVMYQHMEPLTDVKQINKAAISMFVVNSFSMILSIFGLLSIIYVADLATASVPMLIMVKSGVGSSILTPIISLLIVLGAVSTGVNMISGIVTRCSNAIELHIENPEKKASGHMLRTAALTVLFIFIAFSIAQFGLMTIVKKGYAYLGYAALITVFIPFVIHAAVTKLKDI